MGHYASDFEDFRSKIPPISHTRPDIAGFCRYKIKYDKLSPEHQKDVDKLILVVADPQDIYINEYKQSSANQIIALIGD